MITKSDHFDGRRFYNDEPGHSFSDTVKWFWEMDTVEWPKWIDDPKQPPPVECVESGELRITYINHATVLIQMDGINILTDPILSKRAGPTSFIGVRRVRAPGIDFKSLPPIDYVLISHDHYDHLDLPTVKKLVERHNPTFITGLGIKRLLSSINGCNVIELDWWQSFRSDKPDISFTFVPAKHGSGRIPFVENRTLWGGYIIDSPNGQVYFTGDTGFGNFIPDIASRFCNIRLAILPVGNYEKRWFMKSQHMNPDDAVLAHHILNAHRSMGIHFSTFLEHPEQTIDAHEKDLVEALKKYKVSESEFWILQFGEGRDVTPLLKKERREDND